MEGLSDPEALALVAQHYSTASPRSPSTPSPRPGTSRPNSSACARPSPHPYQLLSAPTGYRRTYLSHAIRLLTLPHQVQRLIRSGALRPRHARCLVTVPGAESQIACAREVVDRRLSAPQAERIRTAMGLSTCMAEIPISCASSRR